LCSTFGRSEVLIAVFWKAHSLWGVIVFSGGIFPSVLKDSSVFVLRGKDTSLLGLLDPEDEGITML
jgi:hypothetical protein